MKKSINRKKPFRRRTRKNKSSRKIKGGGFGWNNAIAFIKSNINNSKDTKFVFEGPDLNPMNPNEGNEYFIGQASVTEFPYSFVSIYIDLENYGYYYDNDTKSNRLGITTVSNLTSRKIMATLSICKNLPSLLLNGMINGAFTNNKETHCDKLVIYKPAYGRKYSTWFWDTWLQNIKLYTPKPVDIPPGTDSSSTLSSTA